MQCDRMTFHKTSENLAFLIPVAESQIVTLAFKFQAMQDRVPVQYEKAQAS